MDAERHVRNRFIAVNLAWTLAIVTIAAVSATAAILLMDWTGLWLYALLGLTAGTAVGFVRDRRVFQAVLGGAGLIILAFALYWSSGGPGGSDEAVLALLGSAMFAFLTTFAITRTWGRSRPAPDITREELDDAVAHPGMG